MQRKEFDLIFWRISKPVCLPSDAQTRKHSCSKVHYTYRGKNCIIFSVTHSPFTVSYCTFLTERDLFTIFLLFMLFVQHILHLVDFFFYFHVIDKSTSFVECNDFLTTYFNKHEKCTLTHHLLHFRVLKNIIASISVIRGVQSVSKMHY